MSELFFFPSTRRDQPACSSESGVSQLQELRKTVAFVELLKHKSEPLGLVLKGKLGVWSSYERTVKLGVWVNYGPNS